ncbi:hypothetical protein F4V43_13405 [Paenibacillus spiritus]|uniref:DUF2971 domain-containing protein n=1 Tax=Paenibacillus spiritus TaxID=2496557 RepID=A0A5J5G561_9BACL|nr:MULTISPECIES: abortive infection system antitoxin AbiGi family protein [Paenibacillus]KAA9002410.1 hypothetical protein F4V43_13405 [Paenibacillus spiritus]
MQRYYSNIYWHFTGSPQVDWHLVERPLDIVKLRPPLDDREAAQILLRILGTRKLIASCTELLYGEKETAPFCSVTDVPFKDLPGHSQYYGRVAIGFRAPVIHESFMPVMYISRSNREFAGRMAASADHFLMNFVKMTDYAVRDAESFYREREWRHLGDFRFGPGDVAAVIVPGDRIPEVRAELDRLGYAKDLSVLSWDFVENA